MRDGIQAVALLLFLLAILLATSSAHAQVIQACAHKQTGALRLVAVPAGCTGSEQPISWNQQGPKGDMGDPGQAGEPGQDGLPGSSLRVFDAEGNDVGLYAGAAGALSTTSVPLRSLLVFSEPLGLMFEVSPQTGRLQQTQSQFFFTEPSCQGLAYSEFAGFLLWPNVGDNSVFVRTSTEVTTVTVRSSAPLPGPDERCRDRTEVERSVVPAQPTTPADLGLEFPLPAPLIVKSSMSE